MFDILRLGHKPQKFVLAIISYVFYQTLEIVDHLPFLLVRVPITTLTYI